MFEERPLKESFHKRKPVFGIGINDADYCIGYVENGKTHKCPYYVRWVAMFVRCINRTKNKRNDSYIGCTVCSEWLLFSNFKKWMSQENWQGRQLDKDLLVPGNKVYAPDKCLFVPPDINKLFTDHRSARGEFPLGVNLHKGTGKYQASISLGNGKTNYLGLFTTPEKAHQVYLEAKCQRVFELAQPYKLTEPKLYAALMRYIQPEAYN